MVALLNMRVTADFAELNCLGEKLDIWMKGQDAPHFEPLASKWIETGQEFRDEVKQRIDLLGEKALRAASCSMLLGASQTLQIGIFPSMHRERPPPKL